MALHQTFELHLEGGPDHGAFVALTCPEVEVVSRARAILEEHHASGCDVRQFGQSLFVMAKDR